MGRGTFGARHGRSGFYAICLSRPGRGRRRGGSRDEPSNPGGRGDLTVPRIICVVLLLAAAACTSRPAAPFPPAPSWTCRMHATHRRSSGRRPNRSGSRRSPTGSRRPASTTRPTTSLRLSTAAHIDAPVHFAQGRLTVDQIPLDRLIGQAVVVDVRDASDRSADYLVTVADIERAESQDGRIPDRAIVLIEPDSRVDGPMPRAIWGPPNAVRRPSRRCTFPACIRTPRGG